jgi:hypothetical protein
MICLANSRKLGGRCVAGLAWDGKKYSVWIRPVSTYGKGELSFEYRYSDKTEARLLDVIDLTLLEPNSHGCHSEDIFVDDTKKWSLRERLTYKSILPLVETATTTLWVNGQSSANGMNDKLDEGLASSLKNSLKLIKPAQMTMTATREWGKRKVRGTFNLGSTHYTLAITDPRIEQEFASSSVGTSRVVDDPILCISIGEVLEAQSACYKLIARVIEG